MNWLYVFIGGGLGAVCRWAIAQFIQPQSGFPFATFTANMLGCLLIGIASYFILEQGSKLHLLFVIGFLGGFTTFSSYGFELMKLQQNGEFKVFVSYLLLSNLFGLLFVILGNRLSGLIEKL
ncbi:fluoride efflux transporter CrcB [bacterium]|nr:fluoride efflux transporter CrcB [bacterium]